jgi:hypothetical protein
LGRARKDLEGTLALYGYGITGAELQAVKDLRQQTAGMMSDEELARTLAGGLEGRIDSAPARPAAPSWLGIQALQDQHDQEADGSRVRICYAFLRDSPVFPQAATRDDGRKKIVARTFSMDTTLESSSLLARAKRAASKSGATFVGDKQLGRFSHEMVRGEYRMVGRTVIVTITDKHWLVPWPVVESQLRKLIQ